MPVRPMSEADISPSIISSLTADAIPMLGTFTRNFPIIKNCSDLSVYPVPHPIYFAFCALFCRRLRNFGALINFRVFCVFCGQSIW